MEVYKYTLLMLSITDISQQGQLVGTVPCGWCQEIQLSLVVLATASTMVILAMASTVGLNLTWYHGCIDVW